MELKGFDELIAKCEKDLDEHLEPLMNKLQQKSLRTVKRRTPVDTGQLRRSWAVGKLEAGKFVIYNSADYAKHVEYGHRTTKGNVVEGRFMLRDTLKVIQKKLPEDLKVSVSKYWLD